ncbi:DUF2628 domain-containing protein [Sphingobium sp.]|uniref:DUF2628 domain-containing protein n=1 Tax=Sphingobium sp. TaxID=1912891 RepID=UPI00257F0DDC|nr:DUF2628 domain-containing protein [Sphingobium sp.]
MRKFNVYRDEDGIYEAVKKGWCWPAFFFGSIWALFSGLWVAAFFIFPIDFLLTVAGNRSGDPYDRYDEAANLIILVIFSIPLLLRVLLGACGNKWRGQKLCRLGYAHIGRVVADGKEHAISMCKAERNADVVAPVTEVPAYQNAAARSEVEVGEGQMCSAAVNEIPPHVLDGFLLFLAVLIGVAACASVVGLLPAGILLGGLFASLKGGNQYYLKKATWLVSGFGYVILTISAAIGVVLLFIEIQNAAIAFWISGLSFATICALRYLWLNPLLRQFKSIRTFVFGIQIPDIPKRPKAQKIITRSGLQTYSVADEIAKWKALHDQGVIDDDEYRQARSRLLNPT